MLFNNTNNNNNNNNKSMTLTKKRLRNICNRTYSIYKELLIFGF